ncbi:MAG: YoaK family protein [Burkholderiaceae bacterium]
MIDFFRALRIWAGLERTAESNLRLGMMLSFVAGATNAGGFLAVGLYTSHMTGMLSSMADNVVSGNFLLTLGAFAALAAFLAGAMTTAWLINWGLRKQLNSAYCLPLLLESLMLLVFGVFGASIKAFSILLVPMTVMILCFIMGLQNAVITKISKSEIRTTHVTGMITDLGIELGKLVYINDRSMPTKVLANRPKLRSLLLLIGSFSVGGLVGALTFKYWGYTMTLPLAVLVSLPTAGPLLADCRRRV